MLILFAFSACISSICSIPCFALINSPCFGFVNNIVPASNSFSLYSYSFSSGNVVNSSCSDISFAFQNFSFLPSKNVYAPIIGFNPLIRFLICSAVWFCQSIFAISLLSIGAIVKSSPCSSLGAFPCSIKSSVFTNSSPPIFVSLSQSSPVVSSSPISTSCFKIISPVSIPASIYIVVIPVVLSPFKTAHCIGAAPLYLGNNEPCTFMQPSFGMSNNSCGNIFPYATTHITSGFKAFIFSINSVLFLTFSG